MSSSATSRAEVSGDRSAFVPVAASPLFANRRHRAPENTTPAVFSDNVWPLHHINFAENYESKNISFLEIDRRHRRAFKIYMYNVLNAEPRRSPQMKCTLPAAGTVLQIFHVVRTLLDWIDEHGIKNIAGLTTCDWNNYTAHLAGRNDMNYGRKAAHLVYIKRLWAHNFDLPAPYKFVVPPWFSAPTLSRWLGPAPGKYDNRTEPFPLDAVSALVFAAISVVDGYLNETIPIGRKGTRQAARAWYESQGISRSKGHLSKGEEERWKDATDWKKSFDKGDIRAAAFVLISYFTGMRPSEVLHLQRGCLRHVPLGGGHDGVPEYSIVGREFKGVRDEYGDSVTEGSVRDQPWVTVAPAARAIQALELIARSDSQYLFANIYDMSDLKARQRLGEVVGTGNMNKSLLSFVRVWNNHALSKEAVLIPLSGQGGLLADQRGSRGVSSSRFRRTLAYFIANRPGGEIALGIQYGHVKNVVSLGYAGRAESGFPDEVELEELLAHWGDLDGLAGELTDGSRVSGPAAGRVRESLTQFRAEYAGEVKSEAALERFRRSGLTLIHDNKNAHNVCSYVDATALCHPRHVTIEINRTPDLTNCQRGCPNIAMLDGHVIEKTRQRDHLLDEMAYVPLPLAARNQQIVDAINKDIERHDRIGDGG